MLISCGSCRHALILSVKHKLLLSCAVTFIDLVIRLDMLRVSVHKGPRSGVHIM